MFCVHLENPPVAQMTNRSSRSADSLRQKSSGLAGNFAMLRLALLKMSSKHQMSLLVYLNFRVLAQFAQGRMIPVILDIRQEHLVGHFMMVCGTNIRTNSYFWT